MGDQPVQLAACRKMTEVDAIPVIFKPGISLVEGCSADPLEEFLGAKGVSNRFFEGRLAGVLPFPIQGFPQQF